MAEEEMQHKATILVVDDTPDNLTLMVELLRDRYRVKVANSGERALKVAHSAPVELILLDIMMPEMDGYEVCRRLKGDAATENVPVIFLTARSTVEDEQRGLEAGAVDYITKPISPPIVLARVRTHLALKAAADFLRDKSAFLEAEVQKRTAELVAIQDTTIQIVTSLAESRDPETGNHIRRTQHYVQALAEKLSEDARWAAELTPQKISTMYKSAPLHDIGKVGIPDSILLKPGKLTREEFEVMKRHTLIGHEAIARAEQQLGIHVEFLETAKEIALSHHEKWDGTGYPRGLKGREIPLAARIMALADVYDALVSRRVYKEPMPHEKAIAILIEGRGTHFDAELVDAFVELQERMRGIVERYRDTETDLAAKLEMFARPLPA